MLAGAQAQAQARGYEGQEVWLHKDGMSNERFSEVLRARSIQGVLIGPLPTGAAPPALQWDEFSVVRIGVPLNTLPTRSVCHDNFNAGMTAVQECLRLGYRRPGLILLRRHNVSLQHRWEAGYLAAMADLPTSRRLPPMVCEEWPGTRGVFASGWTIGAPTS